MLIALPLRDAVRSLHRAFAELDALLLTSLTINMCADVNALLQKVPIALVSLCR